MPRQPEPSRTRQPLHERPRDHVNRRTARIESPAAVRIPRRRQVVRHIGILDHHQPAVRDHEVAHPLEVVALGQALAGHLRTRLRVKPHEQRIDRANQRVVPLEVAHHRHATTRHVRQRPRPRQRQQRPTVPVRTQRQPMLLRQQQLAPHVEGRHDPLLEEYHVLRRQPEPRVFREESTRRRIVCRAGHDVPWQRRIVPPARVQDRLGEPLEQRLARHRPHRVRPLRPVKPQPRPLTARHRQRRDLARPDQSLAEFPSSRIPARKLRRRRLRQKWRRIQRAVPVILLPVVQVFRYRRHRSRDINAVEIVQQRPLLILRQIGPESQHMLLAQSGQLCCMPLAPCAHIHAANSFKRLRP